MSDFRGPDGRRLAFRDTGGPGPAVLCLAGLTRNSRDFAPLAAHLAPRYRVIRLDSRGRGGSGHAVDPLAEYTVPVEAGDALALIGHLGLGRVAVIGTSRGGILAMAMAAGAPDLIAAAVLNDVGAVVEGAGLARIAAGLGQAPEAGTFIEAARALRVVMRDRFPGVSLEAWEAHARRIHDDDNGRPVLAYDPRLADAVAAAMAETEGSADLWPLFEALKPLPVLVLRGANSDILSAGVLDQMHAAHPGLDSVTIPDRGHAPFLDEPEALAAIDRFLGLNPPSEA